MILSQLSVRFFRNFSDCQLGFSTGANWILGGNGHGKTNLLEAIHVLALSRSFRTHQSRDLIQWESGQSYLGGEVRSRGSDTWLSIEHNSLSRRYCVNRSRVDLLEYVGRLSVVVFSTAQVEQVKSGDASRRRLVDRGLYPLQPTHLKRVLDYGRVIRQKNSLLREGASGYNGTSRDLLDSWNLQIAVLGAKIIKSRHGYIEKIRSKLLLRNNRFTPENLTLHYAAASGVDAGASLKQIEEQLTAALKSARESEFRARKALVGPHRDRVSMEVDGRCMQRFGSAGQQRSSLIAYQLAQMEVHFDLRGRLSAVPDGRPGCRVGRATDRSTPAGPGSKDSVVHHQQQAGLRSKSIGRSCCRQRIEGVSGRVGAFFGDNLCPLTRCRIKA